MNVTFMLWYDLNILYFPGFRRYRRRNRIHTSRKAHRLWSHRQEAATNLRTVTRKKHHDAIGPVCRPAQRVANALCALLCITSCCVLPAGRYVCVCERLLYVSGFLVHSTSYRRGLPSSRSSSSPDYRTYTHPVTILVVVRWLSQRQMKKPDATHEP